MLYMDKASQKQPWMNWTMALVNLIPICAVYAYSHSFNTLASQKFDFYDARPPIDQETYTEYFMCSEGLHKIP